MSKEREKKQETPQVDSMQAIQKMHTDFLKLQQQYRQLIAEYQRVTSIYARLDYLYPLLKSDMRTNFSSDFIVECTEEVESLISSFKFEKAPEEEINTNAKDE